MYDLYLKKITIQKVRHLNNIEIVISEDKRKHLILTGKNGSGKTSMLDALSHQLEFLSNQKDFNSIQDGIDYWTAEYNRRLNQGESDNSIAKAEHNIKRLNNELNDGKAGLELTFSEPSDGIKTHFEQGDFILAYYGATRKFDAEMPRHVEKIELKTNYGINESPRIEFVKYILDLKVTEALAKTNGKQDVAEKIHKWFVNFESLLQQIFDDSSLKLSFDEESFTFSLHQDGRDAFDFQKLSDGYAAVLDIVVDIMIRMEKHLNGGLSFDVPGIVLIDEIETHLHLELQKNVLSFLINLFPNIQFIVTTHSPFVLSSAADTVIFDLETKTLVKTGLTGLPYDGIVKGFFGVDDLSKELREKFDRYKILTQKAVLNDDEMEEISRLELYLDEIPDYLALEVSTEYRRIKSDFDKREDLL